MTINCDIFNLYVFFKFDFELMCKRREQFFFLGGGGRQFRFNGGDSPLPSSFLKVPPGNPELMVDYLNVIVNDKFDYDLEPPDSPSNTTLKIIIPVAVAAFLLVVVI